MVKVQLFFTLVGHITDTSFTGRVSGICSTCTCTYNLKSITVEISLACSGNQDAFPCEVC